jgi:hypothetical protein
VVQFFLDLIGVSGRSGADYRKGIARRAYRGGKSIGIVERELELGKGGRSTPRTSRDLLDILLLTVAYCICHGERIENNYYCCTGPGS